MLEKQPQELQGALTFQCNRGAIIAVYASPDEPRRFWIAEAAAPIKTTRPDQQHSIYYYIADDTEYLSFKPEGGRKEKRKVLYSECLGVVQCRTNKNDVVTITAMERDRLTRIGETLDKEEEREEEEED